MELATIVGRKAAANSLAGSLYDSHGVLTQCGSSERQNIWDPRGSIQCTSDGIARAGIFWVLNTLTICQFYGAWCKPALWADCLLDYRDWTTPDAYAI